jgi:hypothetical protein
VNRGLAWFAGVVVGNVAEEEKGGAIGLKVSEVDISREFDGQGREGIAVIKIPRLNSVAASREDDAIGDGGGGERIGLGVSAGDAFGLSRPEK